MTLEVKRKKRGAHLPTLEEGRVWEGRGERERGREEKTIWAEGVESGRLTQAYITTKTLFLWFKFHVYDGGNSCCLFVNPLTSTVLFGNIHSNTKT